MSYRYPHPFMISLAIILLMLMACDTEMAERPNLTSCQFRSSGFSEGEGKLYADVVVYQRGGFLLAEIGNIRVAIPQEQEWFGFSQSSVLVSPPRKVEEPFTVHMGGDPWRRLTFEFTSGRIAVALSAAEFEITEDGFHFNGHVVEAGEGRNLVEYDSSGELQRVLQLDCDGDGDGDDR